MRTLQTVQLSCRGADKCAPDKTVQRSCRVAIYGDLSALQTETPADYLPAGETLLFLSAPAGPAAAYLTSTGDKQTRPAVPAAAVAATNPATPSADALPARTGNESSAARNPNYRLQ